MALKSGVDAGPHPRRMVPPMTPLPPDTPTAAVPARRRRSLRAAVGVLVGGVVALGVAQARLHGMIHGWPALGLLVLLALALPTSRFLSRRILLVSALGLGWVPVLWWWRLPVGELGHAGLLLAATAGLLAGWVTGGPRPGHRLRRVIPSPRLIDLFPLLAAGAAVWALWTWLSVRIGREALSLLLIGWDNSIHEFMTGMIRVHGATMDTLPPAPDGSWWAGRDYPQSFHVISAMLTELMTSPKPGSLSTETVWFARNNAVILITVVTAVAAGICSVPHLRRRPMIALPAVTLVTAGFLLGPGATSFDLGHVNFLLACGLVVVTAAIAWSMPRVLMPLHLAALGGAVVGVAHNWALLMTMAAPAALAIVLPLRQPRWRGSPASWLGCLAVVAATGYGVLRAAQILATMTTGTALLDTPGGIITPPLGLVLATALAATSGLIMARRAVPGRPLILALVPVSGLASMAAVAAQQLEHHTLLQYYFWKLTIAVELVSVTLLSVAVAVLVATWSVGHRTIGHRTVATVAALLVAMGMSQVFGYTGPGPQTMPSNMLSPLLAAAPRWSDRVDRPLPIVMPIFRALSVQAKHPRSTVVYLEVTDKDGVHPMNAEQWLRSLARTWSRHAGETDAMLMSSVSTGADLARVTVNVLEQDPHVLVVVNPESVGKLRAAIPRPLRSRVLTWSGQAGQLG